MAIKTYPWVSAIGVIMVGTTHMTVKVVGKMVLCMVMSISSRTWGTAQLADYKDDPFFVSAGGQTLDVYGWPSPNFADFDADGDLDLLCGEFLDGFTYFENIGSRTKPNMLLVSSQR